MILSARIALANVNDHLASSLRIDIREIVAGVDLIDVLLPH